MKFIENVLSLYKERYDFFIELFIQHIVICFIAILFITVIGVFIGIYISNRKKIANIVLAITNFLYTIPTIALFGFLVSISGIGNTSALIALIIYGLMPMIRNTYVGINEVDEQVVESAIAMGSTQRQLLLKVQLPMALPVIIAGFRTMVVMTIALGAIASFIGAGGLGVSIWRGITTNYTEMTMAGSLLVALLAVSIDYIIGKIEKSVTNKVQGVKSYYKKSKVSNIMTMIFIIFISTLALSSLPQKDKKVVVSTKPQTEGYILGEIICQLIEEKTDIKVERKFGIGGGTANIHPAMLSGEIDIYPEYTGTSRLFVLKKDIINDPIKLYEAVKKDYSKEFGIKWLGMYGFNNTFTLALKEEVANENNIKTYSDLAKISKNFTIGCEYDFYEREDGYPGLVDTYGFDFKEKKEIDIGLKYEAIESDKVNVINASSTDGLIKKHNLRILKDDKKFFPSYHAATLIREETLGKYPELESCLSVLEGSISDEEMINLNYEVENNKQDPVSVARKFITSKGLLK